MRHRSDATWSGSTQCALKVPYSSKIDIFLFIPERFNQLIYSINTIIKCGIWQPVKFQLVSRFWTGSKMKWSFYRFSELMLATLIQRYDLKNHLILRMRDRLKFYRLSGAIFYDCIISYINLLNLSWRITCQFFRNMESLNIGISVKHYNDKI